tara:strand:- start:7864 stop:8061 length:198 start_codon:yes stop_codon:yes gene_type:complete
MKRISSSQLNLKSFICETDKFYIYKPIIQKPLVKSKIKYNKNENLDIKTEWLNVYKNIYKSMKKI